MALVLDQLNATRLLPPEERRQGIAKLVEQRAARIYRIMRYLADEFSKTQSGAIGDRLISIFKAMVKIEAPPQPTFSADGEHVFLESRAAFVRELDAKQGAADIDMDYLFRLFRRRRGCGYRRKDHV
jgi:hypothetical protein